MTPQLPQSPLSPTSPALSIAPFIFEPVPTPVEGAAFSNTFQALTGLMVCGLGAWLWVLWLQDKFGDHAQFESLRRAGGFILGWSLLVWTAWQVRQSRTHMDGQGLSQSWIWDKHMAYDQLAYTQLIRVRGLEWLIAPRFYVRTLAGKFAVFYIAEPALQRECARLALELEAFRRF
jgi:hypothetical protein